MVRDFADMEVKACSPPSLFSARALIEIGDATGAAQLIDDIIAYANDLKSRQAKIDDLATSLPDLLLFDDDLQARQNAMANHLAQAAIAGSIEGIPIDCVGIKFIRKAVASSCGML